MVKIAVITTHISLLTFLFCCGNIFLLFGHFLSLVWKFVASGLENVVYLVWKFLVWKFFVPMKMKNFHIRDEKFPHQRQTISTPVWEVFVHAGPGRVFARA